MRAKSVSGKSAAEINDALNQCISDGFVPTLAFVFLSIAQDRNAISSSLDRMGVRIFGATTGGEFVNGDVSKESIAILLLDIDRSSFQLLFEDYTGKDPADVARQMADTAIGTFSNPGFIVSCGIEVATGLAIGEPIIRSIEEVAGTGRPIWGGMAGDDFQFNATFVFSNSGSLNKGIMMLVIDTDKIMLAGVAASGWKPVGTERIITRSVDNWVHEIDGQPAADMVLKYMGLKLTKEEAETFTPGVTVFSLLRNEGAPIMRSSGVFNWEDRSIAVNGGLKQGDKIRLTLPPDFEMVEEVVSDAVTLRETQMPEADALIMFSCIGRLDAFGPMISEEINGIKNVFNVPLAGFFTYGEFGRATNGKNEFHNQTCCWVALKENKSTSN